MGKVSWYVILRQRGCFVPQPDGGSGRVVEEPSVKRGRFAPQQALYMPPSARRCPSAAGFGEVDSL